MILLRMWCAKIVVCFLLCLTDMSDSFAVDEWRINTHAHRHKVVQRKLRATEDGALRFDPKPLNKNVELDGTGKISCKVAGGVSPNVQWYLNKGDPLPEGVSSQNGTLHIARASGSHAGKYTCRAQDGERSIETEISVDVVVKPKVVEPSPDEEFHALVGSEVRLTCRATGDPQPTTHWIRDNRIIGNTQEGDTSNSNVDTTESRFTVLDNSTLVIKDVRFEDADRYGCMAGSHAGLDRNELILHVHNATDMPAESSGVAGKAVVVSMSVCGAYMALVLTLIVYCRRRRRARRERGEKMEMEAAEGREKLVEEEEDAQKVANGAAHHNGNLPGKERDSATENSESCVSRASKRSGHFDHLSVPRSLLAEQIVLGRGEFGEVLLAKLDFNQVKKLRNKEHSNTEPDLRHVIAKVLTNKDENNLSEFRRQLDMFSRLRHENVVRLIGLCNETEPHYMLLEHTDWGDLKQFLIATRTPEEREEYSRRVKNITTECVVSSDRVAAPLLPIHLLQLARHLAKATLHLANMKFTHRDIAARNCVITSKLYLKLSFPAMTKGPYSQEYYKLHDQVIPLRWLPSEAVLEGDFSTKSDVYMYAATVWEMYCKAELPFAKLNDNSIMERLKSNSLEWNVSPNMPEKLGTLLKKCWSHCPTERPQFDAIYEQVNDILNEHKMNISDQNEII